SVAVSGTQTYGGSPTFTRGAVTGLVNGDQSAVITGTLVCTTTATSSSGVGSYPITGCSGLSATNYALAYDLGSVVIGQKSATANIAATQTYGGSPTYSVINVSGLVNGDQSSVLNGSLACTTTATSSSGVGSYPITGCSGLSAANYAVGYGLG